MGCKEGHGRKRVTRRRQMGARKMEGWTKDGREVASEGRNERHGEASGGSGMAVNERHGEASAAQGWQFTPLATDDRATDARARRPLGGSCLCQHARKQNMQYHSIWVDT